MTRQNRFVWISTVLLALGICSGAQARSYQVTHSSRAPAEAEKPVEKNIQQTSAKRSSQKRKVTETKKTVKTKDGKIIVINDNRPERKVSRIIKLNRFSRLVTNDAIDVEVIAGSRQRMIRIIGAQRDVNNVSVQYRRHKLTVGMKEKAQLKGRVVAIIHAGQLSEITHNGSGKLSVIDVTGPLAHITVNADGPTNVSGRRIALHQLNTNGRGTVKITGLYANNLIIKGKGNNLLELRGRLGTSNISLAGGKLSCYWIDSLHMHVNASSNTVLQLAGRVKLFEANLTDAAHLNARYLRAQRVFVKTYKTSLAELQVTDSQNTLASDSSNIYFYKNAKFHGDFMASSGAVLNMNGMS